MHGEIRTERLELRFPAEADAEAIWTHVQDPRIHRNVGRIPAGQSLEDTHAFIARSRESREAGTGIGFVIVQGGRLIGIVGGGRTGVHGGVHGIYDVGYWIAPDAWGQGYATEASAALVAWLTREYGQQVFTAGYILDNPGSGRVLRKLGFLPCGRSLYPCLGRDEMVECIDTVRVV
ncbi:MAG: GNAT family N-acetyltransferase [Pseudomonadota bacterium]